MMRFWRAPTEKHPAESQAKAESSERSTAAVSPGCRYRGWPQEVSTYHLQAITPRFIRPKHQASSLNRPLDDWDLAPVDLEMNRLRRFAVLAGQLPFHLPAKLFFRHLPGLVQPGCTFELLTLLAC